MSRSRSFVAVLAALAGTASLGIPHAQAQFSDVWYIGIDNGNQGEFEQENGALSNYYWEDGDYTQLNPAGEVWFGGMEPWIDGAADLGFPRALTTGYTRTNIFFQLDGAQSALAAVFRLSVDSIQCRGGFDTSVPPDGVNDTSRHNLEFSMNGVVFHTVSGISNQLTQDTFTGAEVGAVEGGNVLSIRRTGGSYEAIGQTSWIQFDYLQLEVDTGAINCVEPICSFLASPDVVNPGGSSQLSWSVDAAATLALDPDVGEDLNAATSDGVGMISVTPTENTTYTLMSDGPAGMAAQEVSVQVRNILSFTTDIPVLRPGDETATLSWNVDPTATLSIDQGIGAVTNEGGLGSIEVTPTEPATYTLTSTRGADVATAEVAISVSAVRLPLDIGFDNSGHEEMEIENGALRDYYWEDGDYSGLTPPGLQWTGGREPWNNGVAGDSIGFSRALTSFYTDTDIYFQLEDLEANPAATLIFTLDVLQVSQVDGAGSIHDFEFLLNGNVFATRAGQGVGLIQETFTAGAAGAQVGPNVLTLRRVGGTPSSWVTFDYLTLESIPASGGESFAITGVIPDALGDVTIRWGSFEGRTYTVERSTDLIGWDVLTEGFPLGGAAGTSLQYVDEGAALRPDDHFYRIGLESAQ
ncbi:hypothetical protein BH23VER1_BH23VER1_19250 [soil metagenome]